MTLASFIETLKNLNELTKPRLSILSVLTGLVGYGIAPSPFDWVVFFALCFGMGLSAGSAAALNQWMERNRDALMERTKERPIPSGRISPKTALVFGIMIGIVGLALLAVFANLLAMTLTLLTLISYLWIYTPSKSLTPWCTAIGTIPGALPPMIGWAAAEGALGMEAWLLFVIMIAWQIPHFMAIAWTYRDDYAKAELPMISVVDKTGKSAAFQSFWFSILLLISSIFFWVLGGYYWIYTSVAVAMGAGMIFFSLRFYITEDREVWSKKLFYFTLIYLPVVFGVLVVDVNF